MRAAWRELAQTQQLTFVPGRYHALGASEHAYVIGRYRDYYLRLDSVEQLREAPGKVGGRSVYTRIVLLVKHPPGSAVPSIDKEIPAGILPPRQMGHLLTSVDLSSLKGEVSLEAKGERICYEQIRIETEVAYLKWLLDILCDLADRYSQILAIGAEAVPALEEIIKVTSLNLQNNASQLLQGIAADTEKNLSRRLTRLLCARCFTHCGTYKASLSPWQTIDYYGCRNCLQSRDFLEGQIVAALDRQMSQEWLAQRGVVRVNWLARRSLFDFNEVMIIQAIDEEVERFAVQVGNDTDPYRRPRYKQMPCLISSGCNLSLNTLRILQRTFGRVEEI